LPRLERMNLREIIDENCIRVPLQATGKVEAITELVDLLHAQKRLTHRDDVLHAILSREQTRSTGIGQGLAVPHGKSTGCPTLTMAIGKPAKPIDFQAKDGQPCELIVLLASPVDEMGPHIQALARISRLWLTESFREEVAQSSDPATLYRAVLDHQG
jgi:fructose-specific phosphotransferase system IIA component